MPILDASAPVSQSGHKAGGCGPGSFCRSRSDHGKNILAKPTNRASRRPMGRQNLPAPGRNYLAVDLVNQAIIYIFQQLTSSILAHSLLRLGRQNASGSQKDVG